MRHIRRAAVTGLFALWLAPIPADAGSQSSDSSSNCSNGRCTVVERFHAEDHRGRRGWVRTEAWRERDARPAPRAAARDDRTRRLRDRDDDDDDDD